MGRYTMKAMLKNINEREKLCILIFNEPLKKADAIILLEGDGYFRLQYAADLYKQKWAPKIVVSGGVTNKSRGSFLAKDLALRLAKRGVAKKDMVIENKSQHTREQAVNVMVLVKKKKWKKIIIVASPYHQLRAFLTFLKAAQEAKIKLQIINAPACGLPWFASNKWGKRINLLESEFEKIKHYLKSGHLASLAQGIKYQQWKEKKL